MKPNIDKVSADSIDLIQDTLKTENPKKNRKDIQDSGRWKCPGTSTRLAWTPSANISGLALPTPVLVINGRNEGPTLCLRGRNTRR